MKDTMLIIMNFVVIALVLWTNVATCSAGESSESTGECFEIYECGCIIIIRTRMVMHMPYSTTMGLCINLQFKMQRKTYNFQFAVKN